MTQVQTKIPAGERTAHADVRRRGFLFRLLSKPAVLLAIVWLVALAVSTTIAPVVAPYNPAATDYVNALSGPSFAHLLGTDSLGRDVLSRLIYGGRIQLQDTLLAVSVFTTVGLSLGIAAGMLGGRVDWVIQRFVEIMFALPNIVLLLVVLAVVGSNLSIAMMVFGVLHSGNLIRVVRAQTLMQRNQLFVDAARLSGLGNFKIVIRHILPLISSGAIVQISVFASVSVLAVATLSFLGFGPGTSTPSWGGLVADASQIMSRNQWLLIPPIGAIFLTVLAFGFVGDGIKSALTEPWLRSNLEKKGAPLKNRSGLAGDSKELTLNTKSLSRKEPDAKVILSVQGLSILLKGDADKMLIEDVSFDVHEGETLGIVGESGCGKTVTALSLLGIVPGGAHLSSEHVLLQGQSVFDSKGQILDDLRGRGLAYIPQEPAVALDPCMTVGGHLIEALRRHRGVSRGEARRMALALLEKVKLPNAQQLLRRYPHQLSGGMAQRVVIAVALAGDPKVLIADEPTTALDVTVQLEILDLLYSLQQETKMAIILVSHDWGVIADLCKHAVVMYAGEVVEQGPIDKLLSHPEHPYTKALLASNPRLAKKKEPLPTIPGRVPPPGEWPLGCHFQSRCAEVTEACRAAPVQIRATDTDRGVRCIKYTVTS